MTLITISIAVSIILTIGAISLALDEVSASDMLKQARVEWVNVRRRIWSPMTRLRVARVRGERAGESL